MTDPRIEMDFIESVEVELIAFKRIESEGLHCNRYGVNDKLWELLETGFDKYMGKYFKEK